MRLAEKKAPDVIAIRRKAVDDLMLAADLFDITSDVLIRAGEPFVAPLKTLDAIHLATAIGCRKETGDLAFATHDKQLARAARALGFAVLGAPPTTETSAQ
jgi:predicted nucleic acid-binding protein